MDESQLLLVSWLDANLLSVRNGLNFCDVCIMERIEVMGISARNNE